MSFDTNQFGVLINKCNPGDFIIFRGRNENSCAIVCGQTDNTCEIIALYSFKDDSWISDEYSFSIRQIPKDRLVYCFSKNWKIKPKETSVIFRSKNFPGAIWSNDKGAYLAVLHNASYADMTAFDLNEHILVQDQISNCVTILDWDFLIKYEDHLENIFHVAVRGS